MRHSTARTRTRQIEMVRTQFAQADGLAFADVLPAERIETALHEEGAAWRDCVYSPLLTLWAFLGTENVTSASSVGADLDKTCGSVNYPDSIERQVQNGKFGDYCR